MVSIKKIIKSLQEGEKIQFFITENIRKEITKYANKFYGNKTDDLARGWEKLLLEGEAMAIIEFYPGQNGIWERIILLDEEKGYIIFQGFAALENLKFPLKYLSKFPYGITEHAPSDVDCIEIGGSAEEFLYF
jgi:hypothetical protein